MFVRNIEKYVIRKNKSLFIVFFLFLLNYEIIL